MSASGPRAHGEAARSPAVPRAFTLAVVLCLAVPARAEDIGALAGDGSNLVLALRAGGAALGIPEGPALPPENGSPWMLATLPGGGVLVRPPDGESPWVLDVDRARDIAVLEGGVSAPPLVAAALEAGSLVLVDLATGESGILDALDAVAVAAGDLDGDGVPEILCAPPAGGILLVGGEALAERALVDGPRVADMTAADFFGLGREQIAAVLVEGGLWILDVLTGEGFVLPLPRASGVATFDLDGDGDPEVAVRLEGGGLLAIDPATGEARALYTQGSWFTADGTFLVLQLSGSPVAPSFLRGDANDDGLVNIADPIWMLNELFGGGPPTTCLDAADANDDEGVDVSDPIYILGYQFLGGPAPPPPYPTCGTDPDPSEDGPGCALGQSGCD